MAQKSWLRIRIQTTPEIRRVTRARCALINLLTYLLIHTSKVKLMLIFYCISHVRSKNLLNNSNKYQQIRVYWLNAVANRRIYAASLRMHSRRCSTALLRDRTSWTPFRNYDVKSKIRLHQSTRIYVKNIRVKGHPDLI